ncbi:carbohydrate ABC transporter permease [Cohnella abietis]|uniref:Binding-protein-dependent transport system inner membrane protein n=1 Tax=Cohnella abietis TaxID=2507935 RepID=A0A3T1D226_9BACL|nr:carbohydrate ABC transporter permease [Cohnella abietis]BBI32146.1 binding-protein-dependent transport system inner membrane protein [Cohnella abietis]
MEMRKKNKLQNRALNVVTAFIVVASLLPLFWLFLTSIKPQVIAFALPPKWIFTPTFQNFVNVFTDASFMKSYSNSLIVSLMTTAISLYFGVLSGYSLARSKSMASKVMGLWIILVRMASPVMFILPLYMMLRETNLLDTYLGLSLTYLLITLPFVTWMMSSFFKGIPEEIEEAALLDGCGRVKVLVRINLPLVLPGIATCAIFTFISAWNEFLYALIISGRGTRTAPVMVQGFISFEGINWGELSAVGVFVTLPVLIVSFIFQKGLVKGLTGGAVK